MVPPTRTKKDFNKSILAKGILSNIAPPEFLSFSGPGEGSLQASGFASSGGCRCGLPVRSPQEDAQNQVWRKEFAAKTHPRLFEFSGSWRGLVRILRFCGLRGLPVWSPVRSPKKDFQNQFWQKEFVAKSHPRNFLVFRVLGRARSRPQVLQAQRIRQCAH